MSYLQKNSEPPLGELTALPKPPSWRDRHLRFATVPHENFADHYWFLIQTLRQRVVSRHLGCACYTVDVLKTLLALYGVQGNKKCLLWLHHRALKPNSQETRPKYYFYLLFLLFIGYGRPNETLGDHHGRREENLILSAAERPAVDYGDRRGQHKVK